MAKKQGRNRDKSIIPKSMKDLMVESAPATGKLTSNGVPLVDPAREAKSASQWTKTELKAWALHEIQATENASDDQLAEAARQAFDYPAAWTGASIRLVLGGDPEPAKTSKGVWVEDITRDSKPLSEWTQWELGALLGGEITSQYTHAEAIEAARQLLITQDGKPLPALRYHDSTVVAALTWPSFEVEVTANDVPVDGTTLLEVPVCDLLDVELEDYMKQRLGIPPLERQVELLMEIHKRHNLDTSVCLEDAANLIYNNTPIPKTPTGVQINDLVRDSKAAEDWSDDELRAWADGLIAAGEYAPEDHLAKEIARRSDLPLTWSAEEVKAYFATGTRPPKTADEFTQDDIIAWLKGGEGDTAGATQIELSARALSFCAAFPEAWSVKDKLTYLVDGIEPQKTSQGVWVNDLSRDGRSLVHWSDAEIKSWALGEIHLPERYTDTELCDILRARLNVDYVDADLKRFLADGTVPPTIDFGAQILPVDSQARSELPVNEWTTLELAAAYLGKISRYDNAEDIIFTALAQRVGATNAWCDADVVKAATEEGYEPTKTTHGYLVNDATRDNKPIAEWEDDEIVDFLNSEIAVPQVIPIEQIAKTCRSRREFPESFSDQLVLEHFAEKTDVEKTPFGDYVRDPERNKKPAKDWTDSELDAFLLGLLQPSLTANMDQLTARCREYKRFPDAWTIYEAIDFYKNGVEPARVSTGAWRHNAHITDGWVPSKNDLAILAGAAKKEIDLPASVNVAQQARRLYALTGVTDEEITQWLASLSREEIEAPFDRQTLLRVIKASEWTADDLRQWLRGEVPAHRASDADLFTQVRRLFQIVDTVADEELANYVLNEAASKVTSTGVLVNDPVRDEKSASQWSSEELVAWCRGEIEPGIHCTHETLRNALVRLWPDIQKAWSLSEAKVYVGEGITPAKSESGFWVEDLTRATRYVGDWPSEELIAAIKGEINLPGNVTPSAVYAAFRIQKGISDRWSDQDVLHWVSTGKEPAAAGNVLVRDPRREQKHPREWTDDEVRTWLTGGISATLKAPADVLMLEARRRFGYNDAWTDEQVIANAVEGTVPAKTSTGVWVIDRNRAGKTAEQWSIDELKAFAKGEISPGATVSPKSLINAARKWATINVSQSVEQWSNQEIFQWLKSGVKPTLSSGGFYVNSPMRATLQAEEWSKDELVGWLKGELPATKEASADALMDAVITKWQLPAAWSEEAVKGYVLFNRQPAKTTNGLWVDDQVRKRKPAQHWSLEEIRAWAANEIEPGILATDALLHRESRIRFHLSEGLSDEKLKHLVATMKEEPLSMSIQLVRQTLSDYAAGMGPGVKVTEEEAAGFQQSLYRTFVRVLNMQGREFVDGWTTILDFINNNRNTLFTEKKANRGWSLLKMADRDRKNFEQILDLAIRTADPSTRYDKARNTNLGVALRGITSESARQLIMQYYQVG